MPVACAPLAATSPLPAQETREACVAPGSPLRLDHVPIAVGDLDALARRLTDEFGFRVGPRASGEDGLAVATIGFEDGSRLELKTVETTTAPAGGGGPEAGRYAHLISDGGGGAYLALAAPDLAQVLEDGGEIEPELAAASSVAGDRAAFPPEHPLNALFIVGAEGDGAARSGAERSDAEAHPNGARGLQAVWVMVEDPARLARFLLAFGARDCGASRHPEHLYGRAIGIRGGTVYIVDARLWMADPESAPIVSLTVRGGPDSTSDNIVLGNAGGLWIELRPAAPEDNR